MVHSNDENEKKQIQSVELTSIFIHDKRSTYRGPKTRQINSYSWSFHDVTFDEVECPHFDPIKRECSLGERMQLKTRKANCSIPLLRSSSEQDERHRKLPL